MPEKDNKILKYNYGEKSIKAPFIIYADIINYEKKRNDTINKRRKELT